MKPGLSVGQVGTLTWTVTPEHTIHLGADQLGGGSVVFSTPAMVNLMEHAALAALQPYLEPGEESVGASIQVEHLAATPIAAAVRAEATVSGIDGRLIDFQVAAFDDLEQIGRGLHRRAVIRVDRLADKLAAKAQNLTPAEVLPMHIVPNAGDLPELETMLVETDGPIATVTLNRPRQLNAVNSRMTADFEQLIAWLAGHADELRVVIVTGAGKAFSAGDDIKELATLDMAAARHLSWRQARVYLAFERLPQVIVAAVNGQSLGAGCVAAVACDFRVASHAARFGMPEILLGWAPGYGVAQLTALVGKARALKLCLTGEQISAQEALAWGLVDKVVPEARLPAAAREFAGQLLEMPALALRETKRIVHADEGSQPKIAYLGDTAAYMRCLETADAREGIAAFVAKRKPQFGGG